MNIIPSSKFLKEYKHLKKKYPSIYSDVDELIESLKITPIQGVPMRSNCYKIRLKISSKKRGKSGGARVITYVRIVEDTIFLLSIYDKSEQEDITDKELDDVLKSIGLLPPQ